MYNCFSLSLVVQTVKDLPAMQETQEAWVGSLRWKIPWRRKWKPTPVLLPGEFLGQRSLAGYSPRGHKESDKTESLTLSLFDLNITVVSRKLFSKVT